MQRNDDVLEEDNVLVSQRNSESTNDTRQNVEKLGGTVELVVLVNKCKEALVDGLSNHFSSWNKLGVQLVKNVFEVVTFDRLLRVKQLEEFLNELRSNVDLERSYFDGFVDNELQEKLINSLQMRPGRVDLILSLDARFRKIKIGLLDVWQRSKDIFLDHGHDIVEVRNDQTDDCLLVLQVLLDLIDRVKPLSFALYILGLVLVVVVLLADQQLLLEALLIVMLSLRYALSACSLVSSTRRQVLACGTGALSLSGILLVVFRKMLTHFLMTIFSSK